MDAALASLTQATARASLPDRENTRAKENMLYGFYDPAFPHHYMPIYRYSEKAASRGRIWPALPPNDPVCKAVNQRY